MPERARLTFETGKNEGRKNYWQEQAERQSTRSCWYFLYLSLPFSSALNHDRNARLRRKDIFWSRAAPRPYVSYDIEQLAELGQPEKFFFYGLPQQFCPIPI